MEPNQQDPSYSVDYLNQIAVKPRSKFPFSPKQTVIASVLLGLVVAVIVLANVLSGSTNPLERLGARLQSIDTIVSESQGNLKDSELRSLNSSLGVYITSANRDLEPILKSKGITKISSSISKKESPTGILNKLEDARLNAVFDRTYAREMAYILEITISLINQISASSPGTTTQDFLDTTLNNIEPTQKAFEEFQSLSS